MGIIGNNSTLEMVPTFDRNKTHKLCQRCGKVKPVKEFRHNASTLDGLGAYCKECLQEYHLFIRGKRHYGLHKRSYPLDGKCEICNMELDKYCYHHWDNNNLNLGIWVCGACDYLAEGLDEIDKNSWKVDIYRELKEEVEDGEKTYVYLGPFKPSDDIHRLYSPNGEQTYRWCPHCGKMKPIDKFNKSHFQYDGLQSWCRKCKQSSQVWSGSGTFNGLHKRLKPNSCELCGSKTKLHYHHWDNTNPSKGIWVCQTNKCHNLAEVVDKLDSGNLLSGKYHKLKQGAIQATTKN